jgi:hypothetical protein
VKWYVIVSGSQLKHPGVTVEEEVEFSGIPFCKGVSCSWMLLHRVAANKQELAGYVYKISARPGKRKAG